MVFLHLLSLDYAMSTQTHLVLPIRLAQQADSLQAGTPYFFILSLDNLTNKMLGMN